MEKGADCFELFNRVEMQNMSPRLHYLDNLRIMAFGMLIVFHTLKLFTPEGWGILLTPIPWAKFTAEIISSWRLPLLFFISGAAFTISIKNGEILSRTAKKVLPILIFGTPFFVGVATFLHDKYTNADAVLWSHWAQYFQNFIAGKLSWLHFWYLGYVLIFAAVHQIGHKINKILQFEASQNSLFVLLGFAVITSLLNEAFLRPYFPVKRNFYSDIASVISFGCYYIGGVVAMQREDFLRVSSSLLLPITGAAVLAMTVHFSGTGMPMPITKTITAWLVVFCLNCIFYRLINIKLRITTDLNAKILDIYAVHQVALLLAVFVTTNLTDGAFRVFAVLLLGCEISYFVAVCKEMIVMLFTSKRRNGRSPNQTPSKF
jgi:hypothetical protein